jgi:peptide/nickel transport system substrate-binding protein/oligopeptide transport system substrate-binding protein
MLRSRRASAALASLALVTTLLLVLLAGCAAPWPFPQPTPESKLPDSQQILRPLEVGPANGDLETLDPALIEFPFDQNLGQLIFPPLVTLDERGAPVDWAASSHEVSSDGLTYMFHLRAGMVWSHGVPIDANTYAFSINRSEDPCTGSPIANYLDPIKGAIALYSEICPPGAAHVPDTLIGKSVIVADPQTLKIILHRPAGYFLTALTSATAWAVPQQLIEQYADKWTNHLADHGGFGGNLYRLMTWTHPDGERHGQLALERNERFWGDKPRLRRIEATLYKSADVAWTAFKARVGDVSALSGGRAPVAIAADVEEAHALKGVTVQRTLLLRETFLAPNWSGPPFDDLRVRQALSLAIDRQALAHEDWFDTVQPSAHLMPEELSGYAPGLADPAGRTGADALAADLEAARRLANAYASEKCGGSLAHCPPVALLVYAPTQTALRIRTQWQAAFPDWELDLQSRGSQQIRNARRPQLLIGGWQADYPDPQDFLSLLWTTRGLFNGGTISIPQVDTLCAQADASLDQASRTPIYQQAEQLLVAQVAAIPLYQSLDFHAVRARVVGWRLAPTGVTPLSVWQATYLKR